MIPASRGAGGPTPLAARPTSPDRTGKILCGRYRLTALIGEGGMGSVYAAEHLKLRKRVAVKLLHEMLAREPDQRRRFRAEAHVMAKLVHEHIVSVTDIDDDGGAPFFVMDYLTGEDLASTLQREGRLPWARAREIGRQLCSALAATHAHKIVHRDLKPSNCFRVAMDDGGDFIKVLDFGIAKVLGSTSRRHQASSLERVDSRHWRNTATGEIFGTMAYMAPEHVFEEPCDHRLDVYAVGVILYEMLTGRTPLATEHIGRFIDDLRFLVPPAPSVMAPGAGIPADMDYLVMRALAKRPEERFANMTEFGAILASAREDQVLTPLSLLSSAELPTTIWRQPEDPRLPARPAPGPPAPRRALMACTMTLGLVLLAQVTAAVIGEPQIEDPGQTPTAPETPGAASTPTTATAPAPIPIPATAVAPAPFPGTFPAPVTIPATAVAPETVPAPLPEHATNTASSGQASSRNQQQREGQQPWPVVLCGSLSPSEREALLRPASASARRCKQGHTNMPIQVNVKIADGRISGTPSPEYSARRREVALCIGKRLHKLVKLPAHLKGCGLNFQYFF